MELLSVPRSSYSIFTERRSKPAFRDTGYLMTLADILAPTIMHLSTWSSVALGIPTMFFCHQVCHVGTLLSFWRVDGHLLCCVVVDYYQMSLDDFKVSTS